METDEISNTDKRVKLLKEEFEHEFFKEDDLKAAAGIGCYFNLVSYLQQKELNTRALLKNTRIWFKEFNKTNLLDIFHECTSILLAISEKQRTNLGLSQYRNFVTQFLKKDNWVSPHEELSLAFMIGYDLYVGSDKEENEEE